MSIQIPNLPAAIALTGTEQVEAVQAGTSVRVTTSQIAALANPIGTGGVLQPSVGGTGTGTVFSQGSVIFAGSSGVYSQSNSTFFWDDANKRLGIGTSSPAASLHVSGNVLGSSFNKLTLTAPATGATLTLADGSTLSTGGNVAIGSTLSTTGAFSTGGAFTTSGAVTVSGAFGLTLTLTGTTNLTLPTTGTVTALGNTVTGSGNIVLATSPSLTTPALGVATATSINKVAFTTPALTATLKLASDSIFETAGDSYHTTLTMTGNTSLTLPTSGTVTALGNTSTGSGSIVLATSPTLVTPTLGVATATSINKVTITAPATSATLTISDGKTISFPQSLTFPSNAGTNGYVLQTDGAGTLSWVAQSGGGGGTAAGGSSGQIQYNNAGVLGGFTMSGDATIVTSTGVITVTKTNNVAFGALATVAAGTGVATAAANAVNGSGGFITYASFAPAASKVLTLSNTMTLAAGADGQTFTFPATGGTVTVLGNSTTGTGSIVRDTSPTLVTPALGVATATSVNKVAITAPATSATLTLANGSTLATVGAFGITLTATGTTSLDLPASGTVTALGNSTTGSGNIVLATSPTLTTPTLGVASATSINKVAITAPATNATLTLGDGSTLATSGAFSVTLTATNTTSLTLPTSGTLATTSNNLGAFAATTSAQLAGVISDETGSGSLVFANTPTLVTPVLGVATASSINKVAITAPATSATLTIADGKTLTASNTLTFTGTDASSVAFGTGGIVAYTANNLSVFAATTSAQLAGVISDETGSGALVFATSPTLTTPRLAGSSTGYTSFASANSSASNYTVTFPAETMTVGFRNIPAVGTKTGSYSLAVGDVGKYVQVGTGGSITIPDATFAEGDVVSIFNNTTGAITITCSITTAYIAGTDVDKATMSLATRGVATVLFISGTVCVVSGNVT